MKSLTIKTSAVKSKIVCGNGAFESYAPKLNGRQLYLITDSNVFLLYGNLIKRTFNDIPVKVIAAGEDSKSPETLLDILGDMLAKGMRRNCTVIAFGGGVVGDIAGLAASLYMRGVGLVQIPTTLLAQVDSSVGGKTAVDMNGIKNIVGAFYQPELVIADPLFFKTLPSREINCGLGEIIKYGALDGGIYKKLLTDANDLFSEKFLENIVFDCIKLKAAVVRRDERDLLGVRKSLNLGHTAGHAFELCYGGKSHGEFVLIGAYYELYIAEKYGICGGQYAESLKMLIQKIVCVPAYEDVEKAAELTVNDKKNADAQISLIVPKDIGQWAEINVELGEFKNLLKECAEGLRRKI